MKPSELQVGDVVQISPDRENDFFSGCFMLVTEPKPWGAMGFVAVPASRISPPGRAFARVKWEDMELVGRAAWIPQDDSDLVEKEVEE
ncbi:MAG TPA: hypothetical protein VFJ58_04565 [Armatimonadota bacterium]|nr:hypothetical protein [Armatimonadota bacterium]